jgi:hypothetical protein
VKNKLHMWCEVADVDEFHLHCSNNECGIAIDYDINGTRNIYILLEKMIQKERQPEASAAPKLMGLVVTPSCKKTVKGSSSII